MKTKNVNKCHPERKYFAKGFCKQCYEKQRVRVKPSKEKRRAGLLWLKYRLTLDDYNQMLENQNYSCALCYIEASKFNKPLHVDHCHTSGRVRGLLCPQCNWYLGKIDKDSDLLRRLTMYRMSARTQYYKYFKGKGSNNIWNSSSE